MDVTRAERELQSLGRKRLAQWIEKSRLSQREAAEILGVHFTHVNQILRGRRSVGLTLAVRIEDASGIPVKAWAATVVDSTAELVGIGARNRK